MQGPRLIRIYALFCAALLVLAIRPSTGLSQNAFELRPISSLNYFGIEAGLTGSSLTGAENFYFDYPYQFSDDPNNPTIYPIKFADLGKGLGFSLGVTFDLSLTDVIGLQTKLRYHSNNTSSTETNTDVPLFDGSASPGTATLTNNYSSTWGFAGLDALLRFQLMPNSWYALGGLEVGTLLSNQFKGFIRIDQTSKGTLWLTVPGFKPTGQSQQNFNTTTTSQYNSIRTALEFGVGRFIPLSNKMVLTPELRVSVPVSDLYSADQNVKYSEKGATPPRLFYAELSVALKFPFGGTEPVPDMVIPTTSGEGTSSSSTNSSLNVSMSEVDKFLLRGRVTDGTGKPVDAHVSAVELSTSEVVAEGQTDSEGNYDLHVKGPGKFSVTADANGFLFGSAYFEVDAEGRILKGHHDIALSESSGRTRLLVFFDFNKASLQSASYPELNRAVTLMKSNPAMEVEIAGYTDSKGSDQYNLDLSQRRANAVREFLISNGIAKTRVTAKGYGKASPIADNETEEGRGENRRVEFVVVKK